MKKLEKKTKIIIAILSVLGVLLIGLSVYATTSYISYKNEKVADEISQENDLEEENENIIDDELNNEIEENVTVEEAIVEETPVEPIAEQQTQEQKKTTTSSSTNSKSNAQTTTKTTSSQAQKSSGNQGQTQSTQSQSTASSQPTKKETAYWCVDGGTHHLAGDGANEHGYYKTWDEAFSAYENYTKGWESTQFKISCCGCGLYYFWATK